MADVLSELLQNVEQNRIDWENVKTAMIDKGMDLPDGTPTSEYGDKILYFETGVDTSGDTVTADALLEGYTAHDNTGEQITGNIPTYDTSASVEMTSPNGVTLETAGTYCESDIKVLPKLQSKAVAGAGVVRPDEGYVGLASVNTTNVFEAGKQAEHDAFWSGALRDTSNFNSMFAGKAWNNDTFKPNRSINFTGNTMNVFYNSACKVDMVELFASKGLEVTFNNITNAQSMFNFSFFTRLPVISFASNTVLNNTFGGCSHLVVIDGIAIDSTNTFANTFNTCSVLNVLRIIGVIAKNGLNLSWSPLDKPSLTSIVNALSSTTTGLTVTLRLAAVNTAFETSAGAADGSTSEEWLALAATKPNWNISLINS